MLQKLIHLLLFIFFSLFLTHIVFSTEETATGGYIGLDFELKPSLFSASSNSYNSSKSTRIQMPISVSSSALDRQIFSLITLSSDLLSLEKQFQSDESGLKASEVFPYTYFSLKAGYLVKKFTAIKINWAWELGHQGYLIYQNPRLTFDVYLALHADVRWFMNHFFMLNIDVKYHIPVYRYQLENSQNWQSYLMLQFDPGGKILNPQSNSALFSIGVKYKSLALEYVNNGLLIDNNINYWEPFIRFTLLY